MLRVLDYIVTISFGCILYCVCFSLFCNVWVCVCVWRGGVERSNGEDLERMLNNAFFY